MTKELTPKLHRATLDSLAHWKRMLNFARTQSLGKTPSTDDMRKAIGESWHATDCAFCKLLTPYLNSFPVCAACPLTWLLEGCDTPCSLWRGVALSISWEEWIENASKMIATLYEISRWNIIACSMWGD